MMTLSTTWITDGWIDFEYKKYILLDYLKKAKEHFSQRKLYPTLSQLVTHYRQLLTLRQSKHILYAQFPENLAAIDLKNLTFRYKKSIEETAQMREIEQIINYSIPHMKEVIEHGKSVHEHIESQMTLFPVGLTSLYKKEGYLLIEVAKYIKIFRYQVSNIYQSTERLIGMQLEHIGTKRKSIGVNFEKIKLQLLKKEKHITHPAIFAVTYPSTCPLKEALLPISKRMLVQQIEKNAKG